MFKILINTLLLTVFTFGEAQLLKTGQINSYDQIGTLVTDGSLKDDGFYQKGITPDFSRDGSTEIVIDNLTGLMWQDDVSVSSIRKPWLTDSNFNTCIFDNTSPACYDTSGDTAATYCTNLTLGGFSDWRLPSRSELANIVDYGSVISAIDSTIFLHIGTDTSYWSSTTYEETKHYAWDVYFVYGSVNYSNYKYDTAYIRCVRDGQ